MRYFKNVVHSSGLCGNVDAVADDNKKSLVFYTNSPYYEEVLLVGKPKSKTWVEKTAMFRWSISDMPFMLNQKTYEGHYKKRELIQLSDWQTIAFTELPK